jgi:hypothetical protein
VAEGRRVTAGGGAGRTGRAMEKKDVEGFDSESGVQHGSERVLRSGRDWTGLGVKSTAHGTGGEGVRSGLARDGMAQNSEQHPPAGAGRVSAMPVQSATLPVRQRRPPCAVPTARPERRVFLQHGV